VLSLNFADKTCTLTRPGVMGILNVTPDSFSDGGLWGDRDRALGHAMEMARAGADIIDIGGESTRPGSKAVEVQQELDRVIPLIEVASERSTRNCGQTGCSSVPDAYAGQAGGHAG
jgi:dihydropteroate synthase